MITIKKKKKPECSDWFFLGRDFAIRANSMATVKSCVFFLFSKDGKLTEFATNVYILSFFAKKLPNRLLFYRAYNKNEEDEFS